MDPIIKDVLLNNLYFLRSELIVNEGYLKQWLDERDRGQKKADELAQSIEDCRRKIEAIERLIEDCRRKIEAIERLIEHDENDLPTLES